MEKFFSKLKKKPSKKNRVEKRNGNKENVESKSNGSSLNDAGASGSGLEEDSKREMVNTGLPRQPDTVATKSMIPQHHQGGSVEGRGPEEDSKRKMINPGLPRQRDTVASASAISQQRDSVARHDRDEDFPGEIVNPESSREADAISLRSEDDGVSESAESLSQMRLVDNQAGLPAPTLQQGNQTSVVEGNPLEGNPQHAPSVPYERSEGLRNEEEERPERVDLINVAHVNPLQSGSVNEQQDLVDEAGEAQEDVSNAHQVHSQEEAAPVQDSLVSVLLANKDLMDRISIMLLHNNPVIKNWENLASELHAPQNIKAHCKRITQHSQTELLFETLSSSHKTEDLRVTQLITALNNLKRRDAVEIIEQRIPECRRGNRVSEEITSNDELMEELATLLDKDSKVVKNWFYLGLKLGLSKEALLQIKNGNDPNCVAVLFDYIYTTFPGLTVERFKQIMNKIDRRDVVNDLSHVNAGSMKASIPLHSDKMRSICYLLSKNSCGSVKDWKHLALELDIDYDTYKSFEKAAPESPTIVLLEWAVNETPGFTIQSLCDIFKKMKRYDVIQTIELVYGQSFTQSY